MKVGYIRFSFRSEFCSGHYNSLPAKMPAAPCVQLTPEEEKEEVDELYLKGMGNRDKQRTVDNGVDIYDKWIYYPVRPMHICRLLWLEDLSVYLLKTCAFSRLDWNFLEAKKWTLIFVYMIHLKLLQVIRCIRRLYSKDMYLFPKLGTWLIYNMTGKCQKSFERKELKELIFPNNA